MQKFELMKEKPELDTATLNYIWDILWRKNACNPLKNADQRSKWWENKKTMELLEELAEIERS